MTLSSSQVSWFVFLLIVGEWICDWRLLLLVYIGSKTKTDSNAVLILVHFSVSSAQKIIKRLGDISVGLGCFVFGLLFLL